jgi:hypothetical protein
MSTNLFFTGSEGAIIAANDQINTNCGFPDGVTSTWAIPMQAWEQDFWFIQMPPASGYNNGINSWTQAQMIDGIEDVNIEESQPNWWPPEGKK